MRPSQPVAAGAADGAAEDEAFASAPSDDPSAPVDAAGAALGSGLASVPGFDAREQPACSDTMAMGNAAAIASA
jgi:hypothetical protein